MKLILRTDVENLGQLGQIVTVKPGYGRNYLIPQGLAMVASVSNLKQFELERKKLEALADEARAEAAELAAKISATPVEINVRVGEGDKLYGSVTTSMIAEAMEAKGVEIDRRKIVLAESIRTLGEYDVEIRLHPSVHAELKLYILREGQTAADLKAAEAQAEAPASEETDAEQVESEA